MKVVVTTKDFCEEAKHYLESEGFEVALRNRLGIGVGAPDDVLYPVVEDANAIIAGTETYRPELLTRLSNLKLISRNGIGYDAINLDALRKEGIGLTRTKGFVEGAGWLISCTLRGVLICKAPICMTTAGTAA